MGMGWNVEGSPPGGVSRRLGVLGGCDFEAVWILGARSARVLGVRCGAAAPNGKRRLPYEHRVFSLTSATMIVLLSLDTGTTCTGIPTQMGRHRTNGPPRGHNRKEPCHARTSIYRSIVGANG